VGNEVVKQPVSHHSSSSDRNNNIVVRAAVHSQGKADKFKIYDKSVEIVNLDYNKPETIADALNHVDKTVLTNFAISCY
jgi:uncharacterized protein YbjT (DUF2867 family)